MTAMRSLAGEAARTVRRGIDEARRRRARPRGHVPQPQPAPAAQQPEPEPPEAAPAADDGELDALRGALVHELDRLAAADGSSAGFRRC
jgi:hypothetical protein